MSSFPCDRPRAPRLISHIYTHTDLSLMSILMLNYHHRLGHGACSLRHALTGLASMSSTTTVYTSHESGGLLSEPPVSITCALCIRLPCPRDSSSLPHPCFALFVTSCVCDGLPDPATRLPSCEPACVRYEGGCIVTLITVTGYSSVRFPRLRLTLPGCPIQDVTRLNLRLNSDNLGTPPLNPLTPHLIPDQMTISNRSDKNQLKSE